MREDGSDNDNDRKGKGEGGWECIAMTRRGKGGGGECIPSAMVVSSKGIPHGFEARTVPNCIPMDTGYRPVNKAAREGVHNS